MNTRFNGNYLKGFYSKFKIDYSLFENKQKKIKTTKQAAHVDLSEFKRELEYIIIRGLKTNRKQCPIKRGDIRISNKLAQHFQDKYGFNGRFKNSSSFLFDQNIQITRYFNNKSFNKLDNTRVNFKIWRKRPIKYSKNEQKQQKIIQSSYFFSIRYVVDEIVNVQ